MISAPPLTPLDRAPFSCCGGNTGVLIIHVYCYVVKRSNSEGLSFEVQYEYRITLQNTIKSLKAVKTESRLSVAFRAG